MNLSNTVKRVKKGHVVFLIVVIFSFLLVHIVQAVTNGAAEPGSEDNPLVSQDYVDAKVKELITKVSVLTSKVNLISLKEKSISTLVNKLTAAVDELTAAVTDLNNQVGELKKAQDTQAENARFRAVELEAGKQLTAGAGTEMILRSGKATVISNDTGGLADLTSGKDVLKGTAVLPNHLLLVPKDDSRGLKTVTNVWILIKGAYTVQ